MLLQVFSHLKPGLDRSIRDLSLHARYKLAEALDRPDPQGRDWRALASSLGLQDLMPPADEGDPDEAQLSRVDAVLDAWVAETDATIRDLQGQLVKLGRPDAVETLLSYAPLFRYE